MKAAVLMEWHKIVLQEVDTPEISSEECLIKVKYTGICGSDLHIFEGLHPTAKAPVVPGHEFIGTVEEIDSNKYPHLKKGDRVVVEPLISCGTCEACREGNKHVCRSLKLLGIHANGGFAEFVKAPAEKVIKISNEIPDRLAALTEPFAVGFHVNQRAGVKNGDRVLVIGGGPIGLIVGMVASISGASVCFSEVKEERIEQIKSFGFEVINPVTENAMDKVNNLTGSEGFEVVFEVSGSQQGTLFAAQACKIRGTIVPVGFPGKMPEFDVMKVIFKELSVIGSRVYPFEDFKKTTKMLEKIVLNKQFDIDKLISDMYALDDLQEALLYMKQGKNLGKILVNCQA